MKAIEERIDRGDFEGAIAASETMLGGPLDGPGLLLLLFHARVRLDDFDGALVAMKRLVELDAELADPMNELRLCLESERLRAARLVDPAIAGKRHALRPPPSFCLPYVKAAVLRASGSHAEVRAAIDEGRADVPASPGVVTTTRGSTLRFSNIADADELTGPLLPCFDDGAILDVPYCDLLSIEIVEARIALDQVWAPAALTLRDGAVIKTRVPTLYPGSGRSADARVRTGEASAWDANRGYAEGAGQRELVFYGEEGGSTTLGLRDVRRIDFDAPDGIDGGRRLFQSRMGW